MVQIGLVAGKFAKKKALGFYKNHARCPSLLSDRQYNPPLR